MAPRVRPKPAVAPRAEAPPDVADDIRAARAEAERGEGIVLTPEQLKQWAETGSFPGSSG